jgi:hypothetical protein
MWSGSEGAEEGIDGEGGKAFSAEVASVCISRTGGLTRNQWETVPETQAGIPNGGDREIKVIAAKKVLKIQEKAGVNFVENEQETIERLVVLEEVAVSLKASREGGAVGQ